MSRRATALRLLRMALLAVLMLGACLQPVLAAVCEVGDETAALGAGQAGLVDTATSTADGAGDCCANPACSDCCRHATSFPPLAAPALVAIPPTMPPVGLSVGVRHADYPVDIRPPITG